MASGKTEKVTSESGAGYCKMPDGTLICWGFNLLDSNGSVQIGFPLAFSAAPAVTAQWSFGSNGNASGDAAALKIYNVAATSFRATIGGNVPTGSGWNKLGVQWIAIGRWK